MSNLYDEAIMVQDASNISGVTNSLLEVIKELRWTKDYSQKNPAIFLFAHKIMSLAGRECLCTYCTDLWEDKFREACSLSENYNDTKADN